MSVRELSQSDKLSMKQPTEEYSELLNMFSLSWEQNQDVHSYHIYSTLYWRSRQYRLSKNKYYKYWKGRIEAIFICRWWLCIKKIQQSWSLAKAVGALATLLVLNSYSPLNVAASGCLCPKGLAIIYPIPGIRWFLTPPRVFRTLTKGSLHITHPQTDQSNFSSSLANYLK